jgi:hypothetical protein
MGGKIVRTIGQLRANVAMTMMAVCYKPDKFAEADDSRAWMNGLPSISTSNCPDLEHPCPAFFSYCLGQGQYGPFRVSEGRDSRLVEINHPLQVIRGALTYIYC